MKPIVSVGRRFFLSLPEAAEAASTNTDHIERLCKKGRLECQTIDGARYVALDSFNEYTGFQELSRALLHTEKKTPLTLSSITRSLFQGYKNISTRASDVRTKIVTPYINGLHIKEKGSALAEHIALLPQTRLLLLAVAIGVMIVGGDYLSRTSQAESVTVSVRSSFSEFETSLQTLREEMDYEIARTQLSLNEQVYANRTRLQAFALGVSNRIHSSAVSLASGLTALGSSMRETLSLWGMRMSQVVAQAVSSLQKIALESGAFIVAQAQMAQRWVSGQAVSFAFQVRAGAEVVSSSAVRYGSAITSAVQLFGETIQLGFIESMLSLEDTAVRNHVVIQTHIRGAGEWLKEWSIATIVMLHNDIRFTRIQLQTLGQLTQNALRTIGIAFSEGLISIEEGLAGVASSLEQAPR